MDFLQSHRNFEYDCNCRTCTVFNSHTKSACHSLIPFLLPPSTAHSLNSDLRLSLSSKVKVMLRSTVSRPVFLVSSTHLGLKVRSLLLSNSCGFVDVERSLWRDNGSAVYNCCWSSPAQSFLRQSPAGLVNIFYCLRFETPQPGGPGPSIYIPQEQGSPVIPPGTGFPFVAYYEWQGYGGGIRTRLNAWFSI
jgi:hypothetical protein